MLVGTAITIAKGRGGALMPPHCARGAARRQQARLSPSGAGAFRSSVTGLQRQRQRPPATSGKRPTQRAIIKAPRSGHGAECVQFRARWSKRGRDQARRSKQGDQSTKIKAPDTKRLTQSALLKKRRHDRNEGVGDHARIKFHCCSPASDNSERVNRIW